MQVRDRANKLECYVIKEWNVKMQPQAPAAAVTRPWAVLPIIKCEKGPRPSDHGHRGLWYNQWNDCNAAVDWDAQQTEQSTEWRRAAATRTFAQRAA